MNFLNSISNYAYRGVSFATRFVPVLTTGYDLANTIFTDYMLSGGECCNTLTGQLKEDVEAFREQIPAAKKIHFVTAENLTLAPMVTIGCTIVAVSNEEQHKSFHNKFSLMHETSHALSYDNYTLSFCRFAINAALAYTSMPLKQKVAGLALGRVINACLTHRIEKKADFFAVKHVEAKEIAKAVRAFEGECMMEDLTNKIAAQGSSSLRSAYKLREYCSFLLFSHPSPTTRRNYLLEAYYDKMKDQKQTFEVCLSGQVPFQEDALPFTFFLSQPIIQQIHDKIKNSTRATTLCDAAGIEISFRNDKMIMTFITDLDKESKADHELPLNLKEEFLAAYSQQNTDKLNKIVLECIETILAKPEVMFVKFKADGTITDEKELLAQHKKDFRPLYGVCCDIDNMCLVRSEGAEGPIKEDETYTVEITYL